MLAKTKNMNIRISKDEYEHVKRFADFKGKTISALVLDTIREQMEFWEDISDIEEYENEKSSGTIVTFSMQEIKTGHRREVYR